MTTADSAYWSMVLGITCLIVGCVATLVFFAYYPSELQTPADREDAYRQARRWINIIAAVSAVVLLLLFVPALRATWQMSPEEFLREYQKFVGRGLNP